MNTHVLLLCIVSCLPADVMGSARSVYQRRLNDRNDTLQKIKAKWASVLREISPNVTLIGKEAKEYWIALNDDIVSIMTPRLLIQNKFSDARLSDTVANLSRIVSGLLPIPTPPSTPPIMPQIKGISRLRNNTEKNLLNIDDLKKRQTTVESKLKVVQGDLNEMEKRLNAASQSIAYASILADETMEEVDILEKILNSILNRTGVTVPTRVAPVTCDHPWEPHNGRCYKLRQCKWKCSVNQTARWCAEWGGTLTQVRSKEHATWLRAACSNKNIFTGGNDRKVEGRWEWTNGDPIDGYTNWSTDETSRDAEGHCMMLASNDFGRWRQIDCHAPVGPVVYVCEADAPGGT